MTHHLVRKVLSDTRNDRIFQQIYMTHHLVRKVLIDTLDYATFNSTIVPSWHWGGFLQAPSAPNNDIVSWSPFPIGAMKLRFYVAINYPKVAAGYVIRDSMGNLLCAGGKLLYTLDVLHAELVAA